MKVLQKKPKIVVFTDRGEMQYFSKGGMHFVKYSDVAAELLKRIQNMPNSEN